jgi:hypothetical protein
MDFVFASDTDDSASVKFANAFFEYASLNNEWELVSEISDYRYRISKLLEQFNKAENDETRILFAARIRCFAELRFFFQIELYSRIHLEIKTFTENLVPFLTTEKMGKEDLMLLLYPNPNSTLIYPNPNDSN